jgi:hypothetical protein
VLGRTFIGAPSDLLVLHDFYHLPGDRWLGAAENFKDAAFVRQRITVNHFRRNLFVHVYRVSTVISAVLCLVLIALIAATKPSTGLSANGGGLVADAGRMHCDAARAYHNAHQLPPDQEARFLADCGR